ncbi:hypothetical protein [Corynebacterium suedekumii]|uniref:Uncharacterized protein n=1 Tax=Corynebacterium suedekumii TaxID=3049801 RepID=A0ABY8VNX7_9CORY|nr:hypothetical protein [Corynebacterium suedekumii]WIM71233.1 hypothetical protein QP029_05450 [Corynebacterium suedekumii]
MSEKQLTVAELLARAGKETPEGDKPRRRRRRSLEDGGISVAELTGSFPAVKEKPAESRHSSVPIDGPEDSDPTTGPEPGPEAGPEAESKADAKLAPAVTPTPKKEDAPSAQSSEKVGLKPESGAVSEPNAGIGARDELQAEATDEAKPEATSEPKPTMAAPAADKPTPSTTDSRDDAGAEDENSDTPTPTPSGDQTVVFQKVDQAEDKADSGTAEPAGRTLAEKITARTGEESAADDGTAPETTRQAAVSAPKRPAPSVDETGEIPQVDPLAATTAAATSGSTAADVAVREDDAAVDEGDVDTRDGDDDAVEEKTSITGVVLLAIIGVVLGVVVFKGFEMLWDNLSRPIVAVLAVLVTVGMVAVVRALRTANDGLSMFLAAVVGLVMTFGPLVVVMI